MKETLTIAAISLSVKRADIVCNLDKAENCIASVFERGYYPDIVVLPELFTTGFIVEKELMAELAVSGMDKTMAKMKEWATRYSCAISGGFVAVKGESLVNRAVFVSPAGNMALYDKRHLFSLSAESDIMAAGEKLPPVIDVYGWKVSMIVCYDLRFPVWCRSIRYGYDVMLVPANWPQARRYAWSTLLKARAIENQASYVGCDRSGSDEYGIYDGMSLITDAYGMPIGETIELGDGNTAVVANLTREHLSQCRRRLPAANDMDDFIVKCHNVRD